MNMEAAAVLDAASMAELQALDDLHCELARRDPSAFMTYVLRDEETNLPIVQSKLHLQIQKLASDHRRLLLWAHVEAGKTVQLSIGRVLFELGLNPNLRVCIVSNTFAQAQKICATIGNYITSSSAYHRVFPDVKKQVGGVWRQNAITVARKTRAKDPSVATLGIHGNILGARIDLLILDDLLDFENTASAVQRQDLWDWFHATLETRLTRNARVWCIGTAWNHDDFMHRIAAVPSWHYVRMGVVDEEGKPTWPEKWPADRIEEKQEILGPIEFNRQLMCIARSEEEARFKKSWIDACLARGEGKTLIYALQSVPPGYRIYTGVDLSVGYANSDLTCLFTIAVDPQENRHVIDIQSGRWKAPEIVQRIVGVHNRYHSIVMVENNAAQEFIAQFTRQMSAVPIRSFTTTRTNLRHPQFGLESIATEMSNAKWIIPSKAGVQHPEVAAWISELLYYDPRTHPGDRLMASWFAREASREKKSKIRFGRIDLISR